MTRMEQVVERCFVPGADCFAHVGGAMSAALFCAPRLPMPTAMLGCGATIASKAAVEISVTSTGAVGARPYAGARPISAAWAAEGAGGRARSMTLLMRLGLGGIGAGAVECGPASGQRVSLRLPLPHRDAQRGAADAAARAV